MNISRPSAYCATLGLVLFLALFTTAATFAAEAGEIERARIEAYRANLLTPDEERIVGKRLAYLYEQRHTLLTDVADTEARLKRVSARLRAVMPGQALEIKIILGSQPEAVSFPPRHVYITSALVKLTRTDDELAAVIAHEAAHVAGRHLARLIALTLALPPIEQESFPTRRAIITGQTLQFAFPSMLNNTRLHCEVEADQRAVRWLECAGYDGEALAVLLGMIYMRLSPNLKQERVALQSRIALLRERPYLVLR
jgi:beta-barrel assembly-enhancing protease